MQYISQIQIRGENSDINKRRSTDQQRARSTHANAIGIAEAARPPPRNDGNTSSHGALRSARPRTRYVTWQCSRTQEQIANRAFTNQIAIAVGNEQKDPFPRLRTATQQQTRKQTLPAPHYVDARRQTMKTRTEQ